MDETTLITKLSRRAMLGRVMLGCGAVAAALAAGAVPFGGPDGPLLARIAAAERLWATYRRAEAEQDRLYERLRRHPDCPQCSQPAAETAQEGALRDRLAERLGIPAAEARCLRLSEDCDAATRAAFDLPARSLEGACAKLRLGLTALRAEHHGSLDPLDCGHLDGTLADLERLAAG